AGAHVRPHDCILRLSAFAAGASSNRIRDRRVGGVETRGTARLGACSPGGGSSDDDPVLPCRTVGDGSFRPVYVLAAPGRSAVGGPTGSADRGRSVLRVLVGFLLHQQAGPAAQWACE